MLFPKRALVVCSLMVCVSVPAFGTRTDPPPTLELLMVGDAFFDSGASVSVELWLRNIACAPGMPRASGFQSVLAFDTEVLQFESGSYTSAPFGLPVIPILADADGGLQLAAGINFFVGQPPVCGDHLLATLEFTALAPGAGCLPVRFVDSDPPTRVTDENGAPFPMLRLHSNPASWIPPDFDRDCDIDIVDFELLAACWEGPAFPAGEDCTEKDLAGNGSVDLHDFAEFQPAFSAGSSQKAAPQARLQLVQDDRAVELTAADRTGVARRWQDQVCIGSRTHTVPPDRRPGRRIGRFWPASEWPA